MPAKTSDTFFSNAVKDYLAGDSAENCAARWHIGEHRLSDYLKTQGFFRSKSEMMQIKRRKISENSSRKIILSADTVIEQYTSGGSELAISKSFGVSRSVITRILRENQITRHTLSEANSARYVSMTQAEKNTVIKKAQDAVRGSKRSFESLCNSAKSRERTGNTRSTTEKTLVDMLLLRGAYVIPQKAIDIYNVDIAIGTLAVEVFGGFWHASKPKHIKRTRYILDRGWNMLFLWVHSRSPLTEIAADYIIAFLNECRSNPTSPSQYRVIRGDGKELARGTVNDNNITVVPKGFEGGGCSR